MKILIAPTEYWEELSGKKIVVCSYEYNGTTIWGISYNYITLYPYFEVVDLGVWHEDKPCQIVQNKSGVVWGAMNEPEIAMGLAMHRKAMNMQTYEEGDKLYFYANTILPEHQAIFDAYPQLEITVNHG